MSRIKIKDNSRIPKESLSGISLLTSKIADKTLEQLENEGIFVFPEILREADDITKDQMILQSVNIIICRAMSWASWDLEMRNS